MHHEPQPSASNSSLGGRLALRPVRWSPLEMGVGNDLDLVRRDLAVNERVGETSNQHSACAVERAATLRGL